MTADVIHGFNIFSSEMFIFNRILSCWKTVVNTIGKRAGAILNFLLNRVCLLIFEPKCGILLYTAFAGVMELVDVPDSKSGGSDTMRVRFPPPAPFC